MSAFVRNRNLPFSVEDIRQINRNCGTCRKLKPQFHKPRPAHLIKATQPFERLNIDFKGPLPSTSRNKYFLTIIDEYSRFPFVYPVSNTDTPTVITCLSQLFSIFGMPAYIHSDRGSSFMSEELKTYLHTKGIATSRTTAYNPQCNGQAERYNGIIMKTILLALDTHDLPTKYWERVLPDVLHSIRSLISTSTNETPHERMFSYQRRSSTGESIPSWLSEPGKVLLKKHVRQSKYDPLVEEVDLIEANPQYAHIQNGRETTVSIQHLAPAPTVLPELETFHEIQDVNHEIESTSDTHHISELTTPLVNESPPAVVETDGHSTELRRSTRIRNARDNINNVDSNNCPPELRRSSRITNAPDKLDL